MNDFVIDQVGYSAGWLPWLIAGAMLVFIPATWARKRKFVPLSAVPAVFAIGIALIHVPMPYFMFALMFPFIAIMVLIVSLGIGTTKRPDGTMASVWPAFIPLMCMPMWMSPILFSSRHDKTMFCNSGELTYSGTGAGAGGGHMDRNKIQISYSDSGRGAEFWMISDAGKNAFMLSSDDVFLDGGLIDGSTAAKKIAAWAGVTPTPAQ